VPIGSVDVTASRESLSLTPETEARLDEAIRKVGADIQQFAQDIEASFKNRLDAFQKRLQHDWLSIRIGRSSINLKPDGKQGPDKVPAAYGVEHLRTQRKLAQISSFSDTDKVIAVVDDPAIQGVPRRKARLAQFYSQNSYKTILVVNRRQLPRVVRLLGLKPTQVISIAALPDVQVYRGPSSVTSQRGKFAAPKTYPAGKYWLLKTGAKTLDTLIGNQIVYKTDDLFTGKLSKVLPELGFNHSDVVFLTEKQASAMNAPESREFKSALHRAAERYATKHNLSDRHAVWVMHQTLTEAAGSGKMQEQIRGMYGLSWYCDILIPVSDAVSEQLHENYIPDDPGLSDTDHFVAQMLDYPNAFDLQKFEWADKVDDAIKFFDDLLKNGASIDYLIKYYINTQEGNSK
jgi:hypothetical protein